MGSGEQTRSAPGLIGRLLGLRGNKPSAVETFRRLAVQLDQDLSGAGSQPGKIVLLVSPDQDGVAEVACEHLGAVLALEMGRRVLVISAETSAADDAGGPGLADVLREGVGAMGKAVRAESGGRLSKLGTGAGLSPALLLGSEHRAAMVAEAARGFDFVLIHAAPVLRDTTGLALGPASDCVLLLALEGRTLLEDLDAARKLVASRTAAKVGVLLVAPPRSGRGIV